MWLFATTKHGMQIFYKDWGEGQPIVAHHVWPLSSDDWDTRILFFLQRGYRDLERLSGYPHGVRRVHANVIDPDILAFTRR